MILTRKIFVKVFKIINIIMIFPTFFILSIMGALGPGIIPILILHIPYFLVSIVMLFFKLKYQIINTLLLFVLLYIYTYTLNFYIGFDAPNLTPFIDEIYKKYESIIETASSLSFFFILLNYIVAVIFSIHWLKKIEYYKNN